MAFRQRKQQRRHTYDHPKLQEALRFLQQSTVYAIVDPSSEERRAFVPLDVISRYFEENHKARLDDVLAAVYDGSDDSPDAGDIFPSHIRVFCILLEIGMGRYIHNFTAYQLNDRRLPYDPQAKPTAFPQAPERPDFFEAFCQKQWRFCAAEFSPPMSNLRFEEERILPIIEKQLIAGGGSATLYLIKLHGSYNELDPTPKDPNNPLANKFVLKTYLGREAEKYYKSETEAFKKLKHQVDASDLIGFYGSYRQGNSYNIILEYANEGTLEDYFRNMEPPVREEDIISFWTSLFKIIKALKGIHDIERRGLNETEVLHGWHQDVKPANILVSSRQGGSPYEWQFKLADLGFSHFKRAVDGAGEATDHDARGSRTYGPPECYRGDDFMEQTALKVNPKVDIWSLGCVFSEALIWIRYGYTGVKSYRQERKAETDRIPGFKDGDCFHNGLDVLNTVSKWHQCASSNGHDVDPFKASVVNLIRDTLEKSHYRPDAVQLWGKSQRILSDAQERRAAILTPPREPPHRPSGPPPLQPSITHQTPPKSPLKQSTYDLMVHPHYSPTDQTPPGSSRSQYNHEISNPAVSMYPDRPRAHSPDSMTTIGDGSPRGPQRTPSWFHRNRPDSQPYEAHRANQSSYSQYDHHRAHYDPTIVEEDLHGNDTGTNFRDYASGKQPAREFSTRIPHHPSLESQPSRHSLPVVGYGQGVQVVHALSASGDYGGYVDPAFPQAGEPPRSNYRQEAERRDDIPTTVSPREPQPVSEARNPLPKGYCEPEMPPYLSVSKALDWKTAKQGRLLTKPPPLPDDYLLERLSQRDHVFLIDNAGTMTQYWNELTKLIEILTYLVKRYDSDGVEMYYTISNGKPIIGSKATTFIKSLGKVKTSGLTDIGLLLNKILVKYHSKLRQAYRAVPERTSNTQIDLKPLSLYVLTDGVWQPECDAKAQIRTLVHGLTDLKISDKRQVGIQFISFGNNELGLKRMKELDEMNRDENLKLDIVDTEPSNGNVWKMLFGAIDPWFDRDLIKTTSGGSNATV